MLRLYLLINFMMPWLEELLCETVLVVCPSLALFISDNDLCNEFKHIQYVLSSSQNGPALTFPNNIETFKQY